VLGREQFLSLGLASEHLSWSFGAIKGTSRADWQLGLSTTDAPRLVDDLAAMGYCGVVVHSSLKESLPALAASLPTLLGAPVAISTGGEFTAFDLRQSRAGLVQRVGAAGLEGRRSQVMSPVIASLGGVWPLEQRPDVRYAVGPGTSLTLSNLGNRPATVRIDARLHGPRHGVFAARLDGPATSSSNALLGPGQEQALSIEVAVPPGASSVRLTEIGYSGIDFDSLRDKDGLPYLTEVKMMSGAAVNSGVSLPLPASELGVR
jgi:hypothetical protein